MKARNKCRDKGEPSVPVSWLR